MNGCRYVYLFSIHVKSVVLPCALIEHPDAGSSCKGERRVAPFIGGSPVAHF